MSSDANEACHPLLRGANVIMSRYELANSPAAGMLIGILSLGKGTVKDTSEYVPLGS
jgi:hypothetical protein